ncbi:glycan-binding surface protein [Flavisolibacter nicotianae]|uniref:glycan-binding surface protein n=1 Tax=Flavisolibacter nicotianae TaxID=2364882 RepID=UPI0013C49BC0|nr:glycan-binding surface protein [Flavisolibacter nicotianae]
MKFLHKIILVVLLAAGAVSLLASCKKEESTGAPRIDYVRVTRPEASDSLLVGAGQGQLIAIMGDNLQDAVEVWFNDQPARLTPTYITKTTLLVSVPSQIPKTVSNQIKLVFKNGNTLLYNFTVQIGKPVMSGMVSEYVNAGDVATIRGDFFYEPLTVTFTGGVAGELVSVKDQEIQVKVPNGALPGPITVKTNFGETKSDFWFRDNRNLLITSDPWSGWWGQDMVVSGNDPLAISGNFLRITKNIGSWAWTEFAGGKEDALASSHNLPDDAVINPSKYNLKFEINTLKPYNGNRIKIMIGQINGPDPDWNTEPYFWEPPFDTKGKWQTVTVPFNEVVAHYTTNWGLRPQGYGVKVWFHGPGSLDADIAFDNLRVVPKVDK